MQRSYYFFNFVIVTVLAVILPHETMAKDHPVVDIWYGSQQVYGHLGIPQRWVNILGNVSDLDGMASLTYSLNDGPALPLSIGPTGSRLASVGDFNVEVDYKNLLDGQNQVVLTATDNLGNTTMETVTVEFVSGKVWPDPYSIDWASATNIHDVAQIVDGKWTWGVNGVRPEIPGYDRLIAIGDLTWKDYEITVPITIHGFGFGVGGSIVGIVTRWDGHDDWGGDQPVAGWYPMGAIMAYEPHEANNSNGNLRIIGDQSIDLARNPSRRLELEVRYIFKARVETTPGQGGLYKFKVWQDGQPEPADWELSAQEGASDLPNGSLLLVAHNTDASFGNVTVVPVITESDEIVSDHFNSIAFNTGLWSFTDPVGDATLTMTGREVAISVPAGSAHDIWTSGDSVPRIMQSVKDTDFEIEVKFTSEMSAGYQTQGVLVEENSRNSLRFDFHHDGANSWIFAANFADGSPTVINRSDVRDTTPLYMRVKREGDQWWQSYSYNKQQWFTNANFTYVLTVSSVGVFAGNSGSPAPAHTALLDYFANTASFDLTPPAISFIRITPNATGARVTWTTDEPATSHVAYGQSLAYDKGSVGDNTLVTEHVVNLTGLTPNTLYHCQIFSADGNDNAASSSDSTFTTMDTATAIETPAEVPESFELSQNYPNPFNPTTTIEYSLQTLGFVTLKVFTITGEEVAVLVSGKLSAGRHKTVWDADGFPSGVYFYRLSVTSPERATPLTAAKRLVLIK